MNTLRIIFVLKLKEKLLSTNLRNKCAIYLQSSFFLHKQREKWPFMSLDTRKHPLILLVLFLINVIMNLRWIPSHCFICQNAITPAWTIDFLCPLCCEQLPWNSIACARCATPLPTSLSHCAYCLNKPVLQHNSLILFNYISPISD